MSDHPIIQIRNLTYRYRGSKKNALEEINLSVEPGEFIAVVGPSQAGKSTLCLLLNGTIPHSIKGKVTGEVQIKDTLTSESHTSKLFKDVAIVFQDFETQLFCSCAAYDVAFGPENLGLPYEEIASRVTECLQQVDLAGYEMRESSAMSGGQKQRLAIAASLALHAPILVLDEPTTDLDPIGKQSVLDLANQFRERGEQTIICVEHEIEELIHADRFLVMAQGRIVMEGSPEVVLTQVDQLQENGVRPVGSCALMHALGIVSRALTVDAAVAELKNAGYTVNEERYAKLVAGEREREKAYGDKLIEVKNVSFSYGEGVKALDGVSLDIRAGEFVALLGHNGSGKTTLTKQINGLLKYDSGEIFVAGKSAKDEGIFKLSKNIGYVFQNPDNQIFADTVYDEVAFGPQNYGYSKQEIDAMVDEALAAVGLLGHKEEDPFSLTKGERERVAVASILAMRPKVLILDEPMTGLDYKEQIGIMELLTKLNQAGATILIVTHTMWVVSQYAHRAVVMDKGKIMFDGPVREVFHNEKELEQLFLKPPQITQIGNRFGYPFLTVEEAVECLETAEQTEYEPVKS